MQIEIWKRGYSPFTLGGDVHRPIKMKVEASAPVDLGEGYQGYIIDTPKGKTLVAESTSGAVVGDTLEMVRADIAAGDPEVMRKQIEDAKRTRDDAEEVSPDVFFGILPQS